MDTFDMHMDSPAENTTVTFGNNVGFLYVMFPRMISIASPLKVSKCFVNYPSERKGSATTCSVTQQTTNKWVFPDKVNQTTALH